MCGFCSDFSAGLCWSVPASEGATRARFIKAQILNELLAPISVSAQAGGFLLTSCKGASELAADLSGVFAAAARLGWRGDVLAGFGGASGVAGAAGGAK